MDNLMLLSETGESQDMGSYNHSTIQANLAFLLKQTRQYSVSTELSLDVSSLDPNRFTVKDEIKPDVCIYPKRGLVRPYDILKMTEMPLLAIEILSPRQAAYEILQKFEIYFALGVKSCWLVDPTTAVVSVYAAIDQNQTFSTGEVVDTTLDLRLPLDEIFE
jgi:Uma2 family endonuclease